METTANNRQLNIVILGHADVGKSSLCGRIMLESGQIDEREVAKYKQDAIMNKRESWWLAYAMDRDKFEQKNGTTIEVGYANFVSKQYEDSNGNAVNYYQRQLEEPNAVYVEKSSRTYNIADAPGHQKYASVMSNSILMANFAVLLVSAQENEFKAGFSLNAETGIEGSTRQHLKMIRGSRCSNIIIAINKMDLVDWSQDIFADRVQKITTSIRELFKQDSLKRAVKLDSFVKFVPISAYQGENVFTTSRLTQLYPWYNGPTLIQALDSLDTPIPFQVLSNAPIRAIVYLQVDVQSKNQISIQVEQGTIRVNQDLYIAPNGAKFKVKYIFNEYDALLQAAFPGDRVVLECLTGDFSQTTIQGSVITSIDGIMQFKQPEPILVDQTTPLIAISSLLKVQLSTYKLQKGVLLTKGSKLVMHIHSQQITCQIETLSSTNEVTGETNKSFVNGLQTAICTLSFDTPIAFQKMDTQIPIFSMFILRIGDQTVATGQVLMYKPIASK